jgi:hypothetical protein
MYRATNLARFGDRANASKSLGIAANTAQIGERSRREPEYGRGLLAKWQLAKSNQQGERHATAGN